MTFTSDRYTLSAPLSGIPATFECVLRLPSSQSSRGGVIIGNYGGMSQCISFEIHKNGAPRLYFVDDGKTVYDRIFEGVDVRGNSPVHLAIVNDTVSGKLICYKNGVKAGELEGLSFCKKAISMAPAVGGDLRSGNSQYFKGELSSVTLYSSARTAGEIAADAAGTGSGTPMLSFDLSAGAGKERIESATPGYYLDKTVAFVKTPPALEEYAFSFAVVGDTQKITYEFPNQLTRVYDWIVSNIEKEKIAFVMGLGDITDKNTQAEWDLAKEQIFKLNGKVPYSLVRGNHDKSPEYNKTFAVPEYLDTLDGRMAKASAENTYKLFSAGGTDFLVLCIDYGASDKVLNWAGKIISEHPDRKVIITTHCYLFRDGTTLDAGDVYAPNSSGSNSGASNNGDQMWEKLVSVYPNIFLVLSGHDPCDEVVVTQTEGKNGNTVTQILTDPQSVDISSVGPVGIVTMLYFSADGTTMQIRNYSTIKKQYYMSSSQRTVAMPGFGNASVETTEEEQTEKASDVTSLTASSEPAPETSGLPDTGTETSKPKGGCGGSAGLIAAFAPVAFAAATLKSSRRRDE
ncbi:MAG: metallophosphoesterase [Clostridia bacterium]|nr:metallophosphoesterase [Clostridia bacterium]